MSTSHADDYSSAVTERSLYYTEPKRIMNISLLVCVVACLLVCLFVKLNVLDG